MLVLVLLAAFALGRRRTSRASSACLLIASAYLSFHSRRDSWFMVLAALTILTRVEDGVRCRLPVRFTMRPLDVLTVGVGVAALLVVLGWACNVSKLGLKQSEAFDYPAQAASFVETKGYGGPLYNDFNWGGYLIWRLPGSRCPSTAGPTCTAISGCSDPSGPGKGGPVGPRTQN